jgi:hypothetical protein
MTRLRLLAALLLSLAVSLASVTMAVARGQPAPSATMVICSGYGVVVVALSAAGDPVDPVHPCPECLAAFGPALLPDQTRTSPPATTPATLARPKGAAIAGRAAPPPLARGPPAAV